MTTTQNSPLVSFVIICYNTPIAMLKTCLDSILALSLTEDEREIILVDDGSEISPIDELNAYQEQIIYIRKQNGGASTSRNTGMNCANGEYIQFIDADDYLIPQQYEHCIEIIKQHHNVDLVQFDFTSGQATNKLLTDSTPVSGTEYLQNNNIFGTVWSMLFKKSIRGTLAFTPGIVCVEDEEFKPQLVIRANNVVKTSAQAYFYRVNPDSITHDDNMTQRHLDDHLKIIQNLSQIAQTLPIPEHNAMQRRVAQLTMDYIYKIITLTHSQQELFKRIDALKTYGLFPLPNKNYTTKYIWFRKVSGTKAGLLLLLKMLPMMGIEK